MTQPSHTGLRFCMRISDEEHDRMAEQLRSACATCVYGFFEAIGYSCGITRKVTSDVVVKCGAYKRLHRVKPSSRTVPTGTEVTDGD